ncbi:MAG: sigma-70 family RNA polymerase sigma factor [Pseudomonadota bacterium]|nr:sigma-70 family RNA polymerase sigma factor [Pseudomonadota bacterium]
MTPCDDERESFGALLQQHRGIVFKVANSYAHDPEDRADLAQEIAAQLWKAWPKYDRSRLVTTWMYRIALNVAISQLRGRKLRDQHQVPLQEDLHESGTGGEGPDHDVHVLQRLIAAMAPMDRALMLLYLDERSHREIAEILGISETNVATKISRLKQRIRTELT